MPAFRYLYVYSPFSGRNWGQVRYCYILENPKETDKAKQVRKIHTVVNADETLNPIDIGGGTAGGEVRFKANHICRSIKVSNFEKVCSDTTATPYTQGVFVEIFTERDAKAESKVGTLLYGHVGGRKDTGVFNTNNRVLGTLIADPATEVGCYDGVHVHMQASRYFQPNAFTCGQSVYGGSSWIYKTPTDV